MDTYPFFRTRYRPSAAPVRGGLSRSRDTNNAIRLGSATHRAQGDASSSVRHDDAARRTPVATASRLAFGSGDMSRCVITTRQDAASPCGSHLLGGRAQGDAPSSVRHDDAARRTPVATASRLAFGSGDMSRCVSTPSASPIACRISSVWICMTVKPPHRTSSTDCCARSRHGSAG